MSDDNRLAFLWLVYGQISAMIGALSLLVFITHFVDVGLDGAIRDTVQWWIQNVRPVVGYPIQWIVHQLPEAWRFEVPDVWKDYFAVGLVSVASFMRELFRTDDYVGETPLGSDNPFLIFLSVMLVWPMGVFGAIFTIAQDLLFDDWSAEKIRFFVLWLSPVFYLGAIVAANAWLV